MPRDPPVTNATFPPRDTLDTSPIVDCRIAVCRPLLERACQTGKCIDNDQGLVSFVSTIAIIGAGELGGALAYRLARDDWAARILLVDDQGSVAAGKALDIMQAAPL